MTVWRKSSILNAMETFSSNPPLRVLQVGKYYPPYRGGMESHVAELSTALMRQRVDVEVLVSNDTPETKQEVVDGVPVFRAGTVAKIASQPISPGMLRRLMSIDHDVVHIHLPSPISGLAVLAGLGKSKLVVTYHSDIVKQRVLGKLVSPLVGKLLERADVIVTGSQELIDSSPVLGKYRSKCRVVPFGVNQEWSLDVDTEAMVRLRRRFGNRIIFSVGRHVYYKGFEYLIRAMQNVDAHLVLAGDGPLRPELEALRNSLGLENKVTFLGNVEDAELRHLYQVADIFVLPSVEKSEAFGLVQVEAMAARTAVINTRLDSAVPFVSLHGETGLTVEPRDSSALAEAMNSLLADPKMREKFAEAGRVRADEMFSVRSMTNAMLALYQNALGRDGGVRAGKAYEAASQL